MKKNTAVVCILFFCLQIFSQEISVFKKDERVVFVGNSITCGGRYHSYIWLYYMTHFPDQRIDIYNEGIGGDVVQQMSQRMDKVLEHDPTTIALTFGMNDVGYMDFTIQSNDTIGKRSVANSLDNYLQLEKTLKKHSRINKISTQSISYTYLANSLPFPIDSSYYDNERRNQADALNVIPFMEEMNHEGLKINGLQNGYYLLKIGGVEIDLSVNLNHKYWLHYRSDSVRKNAIEEQQELINQIYLANNPEPLKIELIKI